MPQPKPYPDQRQNELLNVSYVGIGRASKTDVNENADNHYSAQLFAAENRLYEFDQEIERARYFLTLAEQENSQDRLRRLLRYFPMYRDLYARGANLEAFREQLEEKVG